MARRYQRLNALAVSQAKVPGLYPDGDGLYLQVARSGSKSWVLRYRLNGRKTPRDMGLGPVRLVSLSEARGKAQEARRLLLEKIDPLEQCRHAGAQRAADAAGTISFREAADRYVKSQAPGWKNDKHKDQWETTLDRYVHPVVGTLPVNLVEAGHVMNILEPIWTVKTETASRVRGRIEAVLDWATAHRYRKGDNPARWKGQLEVLLPAPVKVARVKHHPALPYKELPDFIRLLRNQEGVGALALEFTILTAARTGETIGASWEEMDLTDRVWIVPAEANGEFGSDTIIGGDSGGILRGGGGADIFVLRGYDPRWPGALLDPHVTDFQQGADRLAIQGVSAAEIAQALASQQSQGNSVTIEVGGASIQVSGTAALSQNDFIFGY